MGPPLALFDFDGTLTYGDSLLPFLRFALSPMELGVGALKSLPYLSAFALRLIDNETAKQNLLRHTLGGRSIRTLRSIGGEFAKNRVSGLLREDTMSRLGEHQALGHTCVLVSASLDLYLNPWADSVGFDHCLCSRLQTGNDQKATGRLAGGNCYGEEKVRRIHALLEGLDAPESIHAYGDSRGDRPMLAMADHAFWVTAKGIVES
ncbi:MAG: HAD-IB family hydrolase [Gammaproteobacteria bacterium]|nr:HAD-IB family hydrolase [Gammaproteobacteria bacterium]MCP5135954.1 HAD-IB family hydrolase [Gammaproteobacteria bacterium]